MTASDPLTASVIIVTHDSRDCIEGCLRAVMDQHLGGTFEVIVVDNGSDDGTPDLVEERFPGVRLLRNENTGFAAGCNLGARCATGTSLAFVNPDTVVHPGWLRAMLADLAPDTVVTSRVVLHDDPGRINTCGNLLHFTGLAATQGHRDPAAAWATDREVPGISGAAFAVRGEDWDVLGGLDEDFFLYMEDAELSWRLRRHGFRILLAAGAVVEHDYTLRMDAEKLAYVETGRILLLRKHLAWWQWLAYAPSLAVASGLVWAWALRLGIPGVRARLRAVRKGWRRGISRQVPGRFPPAAFACRTLPFSALTRGRAAAALGALANAVFWLNTLAWSARRGSRRRRA